MIKEIEIVLNQIKNSFIQKLVLKLENKNDQ